MVQITGLNGSELGPGSYYGKSTTNEKLAENTQESRRILDERSHRQMMTQLSDASISWRTTVRAVLGNLRSHGSIRPPEHSSRTVQKSVPLSETPQSGLQVPRLVCKTLEGYFKSYCHKISRDHSQSSRLKLTKSGDSCLRNRVNFFHNQRQQATVKRHNVRRLAELKHFDFIEVVSGLVYFASLPNSLASKR